MSFHVVDLSRDPRRAQFDYFQSLANPYVGVTVAVDVTQVLAWTKRTGSSFFLTVLYAAARAANAVPELRRRVRGEAVVEYDRCPTSHTVSLPDGSYCYCRLDAVLPLAEFLPYAAAEQARAMEHPSLEDREQERLLFVSCVPWLSYTALVQPTPVPADSNPRITWGKYDRQGERILLPVSLLANHALVDGIHIARFYQALERELADIAEGCEPLA